MSQSTRLVIAEDHHSIRATLRAFLSIERDMEVAGEAADGDEAIRCARKLRPDVLLLDLRMPGPPATEIVSSLTADLPETRVVILSGNDSPGTIADLIDAGIAGYVLKDDAVEELTRAVRAVAHGGNYYSHTIRRKYTPLLQQAGAAM